VTTELAVMLAASRPNIVCSISGAGASVAMAGFDAFATPASIRQILSSAASPIP
jgi:hypothetical protein